MPCQKKSCFSPFYGFCHLFLYSVYTYYFFCYFPFISSYFSHFYYTKFVIQLSSVQFGSVEFCCSLLLVSVPLNNKHVRAIWLFVSRKYFWVIMCLSWSALSMSWSIINEKCYKFSCPFHFFSVIFFSAWCWCCSFAPMLFGRLFCWKFNRQRQCGKSLYMYKLNNFVSLVQRIS